MRRDSTQLQFWQRLSPAFLRSSGTSQIDRLIAYYVVGLLILVALVSIHLVVHNQIAAQVQMGTIMMNLASREQMLSQRIALFAEVLTTNPTIDGRAAAHAGLLEAADQMEASHNALINGLSTDGRALYFDLPLQIDAQVRTYLVEARTLTATSNSDLKPDNPHVQYILSQATADLLPVLETALIFHQTEAKGQIETFEGMGVATEILILITLFAESFLIFRPLVRRARREETKLREERTLLRTMIDNIPDYIFAKDREGRFLVSNMAHARAVQVSNPDDLVGRPASDFFPLELAAQFDLDDQNIIQSGESLISLERVTVDANGNRVIVSTTKVPFRSTSGEVMGLVGISRDITRRKRAEEAVQRTQSLYRMLARNLPNSGVLLFDHELRFLIAEGIALAETGYLPDLVEGKTLQEVVQTASLERLLPYYRGALKGEREQFEWTFKNKVYVVNSLPVKSDNGDVFAGMLVISDVTESRQAEAHRIDLLFERERVVIINRFIQDASHEFWTPLSIIQTSLFLLEKTADPTRQQERIETIREQANNIERLVNDLLLIARLDSDFKYAFDTTQINVLLEDVCKRWQSTMSAKNLIFTHNLGSELPRVKADAGMLPHAIDNLIKNALSFTPPEGTVSLDSFRDGERVAIRVSDTGVGMSEEIQAHMFERFYRGDPARAASGAGLGLSITQKIIEGHEGAIEVKSAPGMGTTFTIYLPPLKG